MRLFLLVLGLVLLLLAGVNLGHPRVNLLALGLAAWLAALIFFG